MPKTIYFFALLLLPAGLFAQGEFVIKLNHLTGTYQKTGPAIAGINYIYADDSALDEAKGVYYFPSAVEGHKLYGINVSDGSIRSNPVIQNLQYFQYDNTRAELLGLEQVNANNQKYLVRIEPTTGTYMRLGNPIPGSALFQGNYSTLDATHSYFIFLSTEHKLYTISTSDGHVIHAPDISVTGGGELMLVAYAHSQNRLYGIVYKSSDHLYYLVHIDISTGVTTPIGNGFAEGYGGGSITIDEANQQLIYLYHQSELELYIVATINLADGQLTALEAVTPLIGLDNVFSAKYDNLRHELYTIHWDNVFEASHVAYIPDSDIKVYPNPFGNYAVVEWPNSLQWASLSLLGLNGKVEITFQTSGIQSLHIEKGSLPSGIYLLKGIDLSGRILIKKLIMTDGHK